MNTPVIKLGYRVPRANVFPVTQSALAPMIKPSPNTAEVDATAHWLFGSDYDVGSPATFPDLLNGRLLTRTGAITVNAKSITMGVGANFLTSDIQDAAVQTIFGVFQLQPFPGSIGVGALIWGYDDEVSHGSALYNTDNATGGLWAFTRGGAAPANRRLTDPGATGDYVFVGISYAPPTGPTPAMRTIVTSGSHTATDAGTKTPGTAGDFIQLGQTQVATAPGALVACEFIVWPGYKTAAQLAAIGARSVARMAARGITVNP